MSKHIGRKQRWTQESSTRYSSDLGKVAYRERAWYGLLDYRTATFGDNQMPVWSAQSMQLGPFKRPATQWSLSNRKSPFSAIATAITC
jgi:hypothetical protein